MTQPDGSGPEPTENRTPEELVRTLAKRELRKRMRGVRKTTPQSRIAERSAVVCGFLEAHRWIEAAEAVALFWPIAERHELDLRALHARLRALSKAVYYPAIDEDTNAMTFRRVDDTSLLEERGRGFAEPPPDQRAPELVADDRTVLVIPALALDDAGRRLGYGAGYYDRTIPTFCPPAKTIGVCFSFQLLGELPVHPHDVPVDLIVTDAGVHVPSRSDEAPQNPVNSPTRGFEPREPGVTVVRRR
jgi:5-formyltetrahydrofolate cyclo-ligase